MPAWPPSVSEDTVEASATAMADEMERIRNLPGDDDNDMSDEDLPGMVPGPARALTCCRARWYGTARLRHDRGRVWAATLARRHYQARHDGPSCLAVPCLTVSMPVPCRAARLENYKCTILQDGGSRLFDFILALFDCL